MQHGKKGAGQPVEKEVIMKCPFCGHDNTRVIDSRPAEDNCSIRRRRLCDECGKRFTTYEKVETIPVIIIKKDNNETVLISAEKFLSKLSIPRRRLQRLFRLYEQAFKGFYIRKQQRNPSVFYRRFRRGDRKTFGKAISAKKEELKR